MERVEKAKAKMGGPHLPKIMEEKVDGLHLRGGLLRVEKVEKVGGPHLPKIMEVKVEKVDGLHLLV